MKILIYRDETVGEVVVCEADETGTLAAGTFGPVIAKWPRLFRSAVIRTEKHGLLVIEAESEQSADLTVRELESLEWDRIRRNVPLWL